MGRVAYFARVWYGAAPMYSNIIKRYANWNVCFICGFDVEDGHTSKTCPVQWRQANHQEGFNRANSNQYTAAEYDACTKAMHKSQLHSCHCGTEQVEVKWLTSFGSKPTLFPTQMVITSNVHKQNEMCVIITQSKKPAIPPTHAVADTRATLVFVLKGTPMKNIRPAPNPLTINLPDGTVVQLTHICDFEIPGLPTVLEGHIVPDLTVALLIGIRILCKAGCIVIFTNTACHVIYGGKLF